MKLAPESSSLVVTEYGTGFWCAHRRELRKSFGIHVAPEPQHVRPATADEAAQFFRDRRAVSDELIRYYDRKIYHGD